MGDKHWLRRARMSDSNTSVQQARMALTEAYLLMDMVSPRDDDLMEAAILDVESARRRLNHEIRLAKEGDDG